MTWEITRRDLIKGALGFAAALAIPSIGLIQHSLGNFYVAAWLAFQIPILIFVYYKSGNIGEKFTDRQTIWIGIGIFIALVVIISIVYPLANKGIIPGGNERDEITLGAINEIINGRYPYYFYHTKVSPILIMPGWLLLNIPFGYFGIYWMQNCFWLLIMYLIMGKYLLNRKLALILFMACLFLSPVILHELISGSELLSNVLLITLIGIGILNYGSLKNWMKLPLALLAGFAFSSRAHFLFLLPIYFSLLFQKTGLKESVKFFTVLLLTSMTITLPFYLYDPHGFTPLQSSMYLNPFNYLAFYGKAPSPFLYPKIKTLLLYTDKIIMISMVFTSVILAVRKYGKNEAWCFLWACAIILFIPILLSIVSLSIALNRFEVGPYSNNGLSFMFFGCLAAFSYKKNKFKNNTPNIVSSCRLSPGVLVEMEKLTKMTFPTP
jgi:hypothetical protein